MDGLFVTERAMPKCILLVDDNAVIRRMLRAAFEQPGWEVCGEAVNGQDAIDKAQDLKPDLIVLDLSMPVMNGLEAAPVLRHMMPTVPIILFTLYHSEVLERRASSAGVTVVISKADSVNTLIHQADDLLRAA
ncbi:MAG TPA: response regulator [Terriglobales bacterium]|nr:response regulator [Terriglobales bacterium]